MNFYTALNKEIFSNLKNLHCDNVDHIRFPALANEKKSLTIFLKKLLLNLGIPYINTETIINNNTHLEPYFDRFNNFYNDLDNDESKELLVKLLAYRILGHQKVKLPLSNQNYWDGIKNLDNLLDYNDSIQTGFMNWKLYKADLERVGYPVKLYFTPKGIYTDFILKQYEYHSKNKTIAVQKDDVVIDAGGCWGDTALYFASKVGDGGNVFTFEFIPTNLEILEQNMLLNRELKKRISIVKNPVWETSGDTVYFEDNGPGSSVSFDQGEKLIGISQTLSIDDLVKTNSINKIDFIKMDIEGAEMPGLKGAEETIKRFKPVLAIALYHSLDDFVQIPDYLKSLGIGYKFYLNHYTIHLEETILFAKVN